MKLRQLISGLTLTIAATQVNASPVVLDCTAAVVNNDSILESELNAAQHRIITNAERQKITLDPLGARKAAMEHLITNTLVLQMAKERGIELTDMQLDQALADTAAKNNTTP